MNTENKQHKRIKDNVNQSIKCLCIIVLLFVCFLLKPLNEENH